MLKYIVIVSLFGGFTPLLAATPVLTTIQTIQVMNPMSMGGSAFIAYANPTTPKKNVSIYKAVYVKTVTAYSSTPEETDDTPFTTASGTQVQPGVVAANWLPFGTKIRLPEVFGDTVFTVEDRMNTRFPNHLDIWFPDKASARTFGSQQLRVEII